MPRSDLAQENLRRVAASAQQIHAVLTKNPGLIVELKRWVAKDATDHGQMVTDEDLTDQAVFDRLEQDVKFRSIATRLLQRYGYLRPMVNPDSDIAKQQDLLLQARAGQMMQAGSGTAVGSGLASGQPCDPDLDAGCSEEQPRVTPLHSEQQIQTSDQQISPAAPCGVPTQNSACAYPSNSQSPNRSHNNPSYGPYPSPYSNPPGGSIESPVLPQLPAYPPLLRTHGSAQVLQTGSSTTGAGLSALSSQPASGMLSSPSGLDLQALRDRLSGGDGQADLAPPQAVPQLPAFSPAGQVRPRESKEDADRPRITRVANPYADIPSLYDIYAQVSPKSPDLQRFGQSVFDNSVHDADLLPMDLPAGPDYVVGPGDGLTISLWGSTSQRLMRNVDREGRVPLPEVGPVLVSGKSLAEVQQTVQEALRNQFRDVSADVSLTRLRTVRVYVVGDVQNPGAYDISSLSTPLNALLSANGPTSQGSLRTVRHYRGKQLIQEVDLYELLLHGVRSDVRRLESGDTVQVPPIGPQVTVEGMVRRPAHYELKGEKNLSEALELSGGILPTAALRHIEVQRVIAHEKHTMLDLDLPNGEDAKAVSSQFDSFQIQDGDVIHVFPIAPYNEDAVYLQGHVLRPGRYSYQAGMKLTDLISSYNDLLPEPSAQYAEIIRLNPPDFRPSVESFNLSASLANPSSAPALSR